MIESVIGWILLNYIPIIIGYVVGGSLYALIKWVWYNLKLKRLVSPMNEAWLRKNYSNYFNEVTHGKDGPNEALRVARKDAATKIFGNREYPPRAASNKGLLAMWAFFWPINLVYTLLADVTRECFSWVYRKTGAVLDAISSSILPK